MREMEGREEVFLLVPRSALSEDERRRELEKIVVRYGMGRRLIAAVGGSERFDFVVVDRRSTSPEEFVELSALGVPVGIDEGGPVRSRFPLLIDTFPLPDSYGGANVKDPGLLDLPEQQRDYPGRFERVLVSFGGEDPAGLTEAVLEFFGRPHTTGAVDAGGAFEGPSTLTVVEGPLFASEVKIPVALKDRNGLSVRVERAPESLLPLFAGHDLVVTSFGLTAYEAAAAGNAVVLLHPSEYHRTLARLAGFAESGYAYSGGDESLAALLRDPEGVVSATKKAAPRAGRSLGDLLMSLEVPEVASCPVCGVPSRSGVPAPPAPVLREEDRSFFRCGGCGLICQVDFRAAGKRYGREYFFEEYRRQYGKSYLEDAGHIRAISRPRLRRISSLLRRGGPNTGPRLLDVGCAYGPFLQEAVLAGFDAAGVDISREAVEHVRSVLGIAACAADFGAPEAIGDPGAAAEPATAVPTAPAPQGPASRDAVTMWFVIEHFTDLHTVLERVSSILRPGGVFAFSTPNARGLSGRFRPEGFFRESPRDHHTIWSPRAARRVLERYGFTVEKIVSTGHHPERLPLPAGLRHGDAGEKVNESRRGVLFPFLMLISRIFGMGDTFEVYARKTGSPRGETSYER